MGFSNDTKGWIMTVISGIACIVGASIICVDLIVRRFPGQEHFDIQESSTFLSASLSLSFGVMLFSSIYGMLPKSKEYLIHGGYSESAAAYLLIGLFLIGAIGIQVVSRVIHNYIPSHVELCDHTHGQVEQEEGQEEMEEHHDHDHGSLSLNGNADTEETPLLSRDDTGLSVPKNRKMRSANEPEEMAQQPILLELPQPTLSSRRPSIQRVFTSKVVDFGNAMMSGVKHSCDGGGPCYGYSDPCGKECLKAATISASRRGSVASRLGPPMRQPSLLRTNTNPFFRPMPLTTEVDEEAQQENLSPGTTKTLVVKMRPSLGSHAQSRNSSVLSRPASLARSASSMSDISSHIPPPKHEHEREHQEPQPHHHHVPQNAFMSIGIQTAIAIALHKMPEGFITFATNHASPSLGFTIFVALFIHNISEGFAMALPLYLALQSRPKAILWSFFLGGVSQPLGAGVAALWFKISANVGNGNLEPGERVYGGMFAVTAGIMTSVALQLFEESLGMTHRKGLCMIFAFVGMGILGFSFALTAGKGSAH